jgi:hypothetical protein
MGRHYDFTKPSRILTGIFHSFRKMKLGWYKRRKVRKEKSLSRRYYFVKFTMKIDDPVNPQRFIKEYEMVVPARAAFFAKRGLESSMRRKLQFNFVECEQMSDKQIDEFFESGQRYYTKKKLDELEKKLKENN